MQLEATSVSTAMFVVGAVLSLFHGTVSWVTDGFRKKVFGLYISAVLTIVLANYFSYLMYSDTKGILNKFHDMAFTTREDTNCTSYAEISKDCKVHSEFARFSVAKNFWDNHTLITYKNCNGEEILFTPTQQDIDTMLAKYQSDVLMKSWRNRLELDKEVWFVIVVFSVLFGWLEGRAIMRKKVNKNAKNEKVNDSIQSNDRSDNGIKKKWIK